MVTIDTKFEFNDFVNVDSKLKNNWFLLYKIDLKDHKSIIFNQDRKCSLNRIFFYHFFKKNLTSLFYLTLPVIIVLRTVRRNNKQSIRQSTGPVTSYRVAKNPKSVYLKNRPPFVQKWYCIFRIGSNSKNLILRQDVLGGSLHQSCLALAHIVSFNLLPLQRIPPLVARYPSTWVLQELVFHPPFQAVF